MEYSARFSGPEFSRAYGKWRHSIQPTLDYRYVTGVNQFRDTIIVDDVDLVANTSELEYGITNRIIGDSRELLNWRIAQVAYFRPDFGGAIKPNTRNVFNPLLGLTGYSFADGRANFSPIVSTLQLLPNPCKFLHRAGGLRHSAAEDAKHGCSGRIAKENVGFRYLVRVHR
jgi:LPS-assembly protein